MDVLIYRDPRESAKKCSLTPLRGRAGIRFVDHRHDVPVEAAGRLLLHPEGELLTPADAGRGLLLVDCSWRRVERLLANVRGEPSPRRLPPLTTAYPRKSKVFEDPTTGLASVEALYAALAILGEPHPELLSDYRWADEFLRLNAVP